MRKKEPNTREHIIKSALKLFAQKGFFRTTMEDIASSTGVAKGTVYLYFKDKQGLYTASIEEQFNHFLNRFNEIDRSPGTPGHKMSKIADDLIDYVKSLRSGYLPLALESPNFKGKTLKHIHATVEPKLRQMTEILSRIISDGIEQKEFRRVNPRLAAFHFLSTLREVFLSRFYVDGDSIETNDILGLFFEGLNKRR